jgi:5-methylcytosine-specific restriction endonuclease McrA
VYKPQNKVSIKHKILRNKDGVRIGLACLYCGEEFIDSGDKKLTGRSLGGHSRMNHKEFFK